MYDKEKHRLYSQTYRQRHPDKVKAYNTVYNRIRRPLVRFKWYLELSKKIQLTPTQLRHAIQGFTKLVKKRDNYKCQICGKNGEIVHHILHKSKYPKLMLIINNGITLCRPCHLEVHGRVWRD